MGIEGSNEMSRYLIILSSYVYNIGSPLRRGMDGGYQCGGMTGGGPAVHPGAARRMLERVQTQIRPES